MAIAEIPTHDFNSLFPGTSRPESELEDLYGVPVLEFLHTYSKENEARREEKFYVRLKKHPFSTVALSVLDTYGERIFLCVGNMLNNNFYEVTSDKALTKNRSMILFGNPEAAQRNRRVSENNRFPSRDMPRLAAHAIVHIVNGMQLQWNSSAFLETGGKELYSYIERELSDFVTITPPSPADNILHYSLTPRQSAI